MSTVPAEAFPTPSRYGFDTYPLIAQNPHKPHISLRQHPNGPVYYDSAEDRLGSPGSYIQGLVDDGHLDVFFEVHWLAMSLWAVHRTPSVELMPVESVAKVREALKGVRGIVGCGCGGDYGTCDRCDGIVAKSKEALALLPGAGEGK